MFNAAFVTLYEGTGVIRKTGCNAMEPTVEDLEVALAACANAQYVNSLHVQYLLLPALPHNREKRSRNRVHAADIDPECFVKVSPLAISSPKTPRRRIRSA